MVSLTPNRFSVVLKAPEGTSQMSYDGDTYDVDPETGHIELPKSAEEAARSLGFTDPVAEPPAKAEKPKGVTKDDKKADKKDDKKDDRNAEAMSAAEVTNYIDEHGIIFPDNAKLAELRALVAKHLAGEPVATKKP